MQVKLQCAACSARCSGKIPDGTRQVKCPKCRAPIEVPATEEEEVFVGELVEDGDERAAAPVKPPPLPPMVLPAPPDEPAKKTKSKKESWELLTPRAFGLYPKSIMGGLVYDLGDADTDDVLGRATEKVSAGKALAGFLVGRSMMEGTIAITDDESDQPVMLIERTNFTQGIVGAKPCKVQLRDHRDDLLAKFEVGELKWAGLALNFDVDCVVYDHSKREWAVAEGPKAREPDYVFRDAKGKKIARVRAKGKTQGFMAAASSWTGKGGWLKISLDENFDATPDDKLIILGTAIAIEFIVTTLTETKPGTIRIG